MTSNVHISRGSLVAAALVTLGGVWSAPLHAEAPEVIALDTLKPTVLVTWQSQGPLFDSDDPVFRILPLLWTQGLALRPRGHGGG